MNFLTGLLSYFKVIGSTTAETPGTTTPLPGGYRVVRTDVAGHLEVVAPAGAPIDALIYGYGGDGSTLNPFAQYPFSPQQGVGFRDAVGAVSQTIGPVVAGKYHQIVVTTLCWVRVGGVGLGNAVVGTNAGGGDFPLAPGTYLWLPTDLTRYLSHIRDSVDGVICIGQAEA